MPYFTESLLADLFLLGATLYTLIYIFFEWKFQHWSKKKIPHTKPKLLYGDMKGANSSRSLGIVLKDIYNEGRGHKLFGFWRIYSPTLMIRDLDMVRAVLIKDFNYFHDRGIALDEEVEPLAGESKGKRKEISMSSLNYFCS
jgi:cytochrome P450 family 6